MRTGPIALAIALSGIAAALSVPAAVASQDRGKPRLNSYSSGSYEVRESHRTGKQHRYRARRQSADSEADIIRAESCDPGGRFDSYPAWARAAFTCGSQR